MADTTSISLGDVLAGVKGIKTALAAGEPLNALEQTWPLQQFLVQTGRSVGFKAGPDDDKLKSEIATELRECESLCKHPPAQAKPFAANNPVSKIGDGAWAKVILQIVTTILPMFI